MPHVIVDYFMLESRSASVGIIAAKACNTMESAKPEGAVAFACRCFGLRYGRVCCTQRVCCIRSYEFTLTLITAELGENATN